MTCSSPSGRGGLRPRRLGLLGLLLLTCAEPGAAKTPEEILVAFFGPGGIEEPKACYTGEMLEYYAQEKTLGQLLSPDVRWEPRLIESAGSRRVYVVDLVQSGRKQNWYAYLQADDGGWKLAGVRTLALTALPDMALLQLEALPQRSPDEEWGYQNLLLTLSPDDRLKDFVRARRAGLRSIADAALAGEMEKANEMARAEFLSGVRLEDGCVVIDIGGVVDNVVGILYVAEGASPPTMDLHGYIYVEQVEGPWYVFKTT